MAFRDISIPLDGRTYIVHGTTFLASGEMVQSRFEVDTGRPDPLVSNLWYIDGTWYQAFEPAALERLGTMAEKARPFRWMTHVRLRSQESPPYSEGQALHGYAGLSRRSDPDPAIPRGVLALLAAVDTAFVIFILLPWFPIEFSPRMILLPLVHGVSIGLLLGLQTAFLRFVRRKVSASRKLAPAPGTTSRPSPLGLWDREIDGSPL